MPGMLVADKPKKARAKPGPKPDPDSARTEMLRIRARPDWKAAVEELAAFDRDASVADLFDRAITAYARSIDFPKPIPKR